MEIFALAMLLLFSVVGFAAIFFTTFGTFIIILGALIYSFMTGWAVLDLKILAILLTLYFCGEVLEYLFVIVGAKRFGASNAATAGAIIGGIVGALAGVALLGVGIVIGTFLGIFLGAFLVEYTIHKDLLKSLKAGAGGVIGRLGSIAAKVVLAAIMFFIIVSRILDAGVVFR